MNTAGGWTKPEVLGQRSKASIDRKSTRLNSSHGYISYAVFCLKKKNEKRFSRRAPGDLAGARRIHLLGGPQRPVRGEHLRRDQRLHPLSATRDPVPDRLHRRPG